jgi:hypothetical protein
MTELNLPVAWSPPLSGLVSKTAVPSNDKVAGYATRINHHWRRTVEGILSVAKDCAAAKRELTDTEKQELYKRLPFGKSMFSKLATIGENDRLFEHRELLPASISTLYMLCGLSNERFELAIAEGVVRPDMTRDELEAWITEEEPKAAATKKKDEPKATTFKKVRVPARLYCLIADEMPSDEQHLQYENQLVRWAEEQGMKAHVFTGENLASEFRDYLNSGSQPV